MNLDYFKMTPVRNLSTDVELNNVSIRDLVDLIRNENVQHYVNQLYNFDRDENVNITNIKRAFKVIKSHVERFNRKRLLVQNNNVDVEVLHHQEIQKSLFNFQISNCIDEDTGENIQNASCVAIYNSIGQFYDDRKLKRYLNYLKDNNLHDILSSVNHSWKDYYNRAEYVPLNVFRTLYDGEYYFAKSINKQGYKEYGIGEVFVIAILEHIALQKQNNSISFTIDKLSLSESEIDFQVSSNEAYQTENGALLPSMRIYSKDDGETGISISSMIKFRYSVEREEYLYFYTRKDKNLDIHEKVSFNHTVSENTFVEKFSAIKDIYYNYQNIVTDIDLFSQVGNLQELLARLEQKIESNNSPFREVQSVRDLFKRDSIRHIENLASLLEYCGQIETLELDYDIESKLRYLISNLLIYNKADY